MRDENIKTEDFLKEMLIVLRETFEGSPEGAGSAYLDQRIGVFSTLEETDFEAASKSIHGTTIAAHTEHSKFYVDRLCEFLTGRTEKVNWDQSWLIETVNEEEWNFLKTGMKNSYENLLRTIAGIEVWNQETIADPIAIIAHTAYHLGSIRQIKKSLEE